MPNKSLQHIKVWKVKNSMLDLVNISGRGIKKAKDRPTLSYHGWAMSKLDSDGRDWNEEAVHVSDYKIILNEEDRKCHRQLWHRFNGDERSDDSLWKQVMFDQGSKMHERFSYYISLGLPNAWQVYGIEVNCTDWLPNDDVGSADLVLWKPDDKEFLVVEIKTQRGRGIQRIKSNGKPKNSHRLQCQGYLYALKRRFLEEYNNPTVKGCVFYLDREGQNEPLMFPVDSLDHRIEDASKLANEIREQNIAPDKMKLGAKVSRNKTTSDSVYMDVPWQCQYCEYRGVSCDGAIEESLEYNNKLGTIDDDDNVVITADVDNVDSIQEKMQRSYDNGQVIEK